MSLVSCVKMQWLVGSQDKANASCIMIDDHSLLDSSLPSMFKHTQRDRLAFLSFPRSQEILQAIRQTKLFGGSLAKVLSQRIQEPSEDGFWGVERGLRYLLRRYQATLWVWNFQRLPTFFLGCQAHSCKTLSTRSCRSAFRLACSAFHVEPRIIPRRNSTRQKGSTRNGLMLKGKDRCVG